MISYHLETYNEFAVPWDKEESIIGYEATRNKVHLATPVAADEHPRRKFDAYNSGLVEYPIHGRCWEILSNHPVGASRYAFAKAQRKYLTGRITLKTTCKVLATKKIMKHLLAFNVLDHLVLLIGLDSQQ